jgi:hypothetical protein
MNALKMRHTKHNGPEALIQEAIEKKLLGLGWYVRSTHGSMYQCGFPDLFACHLKYGTRWVEVKNPTGYSFTSAQLEVFPKFTANGVGVWVLISDQDSEIAKLFKPANWYQYLSIMR